MIAKYIAGNNLKKAINISNNLIKNRKKPILNYAIEKSLSKELIKKEFFDIFKMLDHNYKIAIKLSLFDFDQKVIDDVINLMKQKDITILIDAEDDKNYKNYDDFTNNLIIKHNNDKCALVKTYQMYRKDSFDNLSNDINMMNYNNCFLGVKLVRGAYWNTDKITNNLYLDKNDTDLNYNEGIMKLYKDNKNSYNLLATHNTESINLGYLLNKIDKDNNFEFAHLMGMKQSKFNNLLDKKQSVNMYVPYGPYKYMIPYLVRRLYENVDTVKYMI